MIKASQLSDAGEALAELRRLLLDLGQEVAGALLVSEEPLRSAEQATSVPSYVEDRLACVDVLFEAAHDQLQQLKQAIVGRETLCD